MREGSGATTGSGRESAARVRRLRAGSNRHLLREDFFDELSRGYKTSSLTFEHRDELMHARECA